MSQSSRLLRGFSANLFAIATRVAVQFATLPIFFANWDVEAIGIWLILFAIPSYIALVGNGFSGAGGTAALAAAQAGDMARARRDFRAAWAFSAGSTAGFALLFVGAAMFVIPSLVERGDGLDLWDIAQAAAWLALYVFATSQMGTFEIPYRAVGKYPDHMFLYNAASLIEIVVIAAAVTFSDSLATLAMSLAIYRSLAAAWIYLSAMKAAAVMFEPTGERLSASLPDLWRPSLAFMMVPLIFGLNLQGYLLLVGASFGAVVLAGFAATRTLTRLLELVTNLIYGIQFYESGYLDKDRRTVQRSMLATMTLVSLAISIVFGAVLMALGPWLQNLYTLGETGFQPTVALVLIVASMLRALSATPAAIVAAENAHARFVAIYLAGSIVGLLVAMLLARAGAPLPAILSALVIAETCQLVPATRRALEMLDWTPRQFLAALGSPERLDDVRALWRKLVVRP